MPALLFTLMSLRFNPCSPMCTVGGNIVVSLPSVVVTVMGSGGIVISLFIATVEDIRLGTLFIISVIKQHVLLKTEKINYRKAKKKNNNILHSNLKLQLISQNGLDDRIFV